MFIRFLKNLVIFSLLLVGTDQLLGWGLRKAYFSARSGVCYQMNYAMDSVKSDIVILGSSRAIHHYVSSVFEDSLGMSCYNAGYDGMGVLFHDAVLSRIMQNHTPKLVILDINSFEFYNKAGEIPALAPYYGRNSRVDQIINLVSPYETTRRWSAIYPFNSKVVAIIIGMLSEDHSRKGYQPLFGKMVDKPQKDSSERVPIVDQDKLDAFEHIVALCRVRKVGLVVVQSPRYRISKRDDTFDQILTQHGVEYFNYADSPLFMERPDYFKDTVHMNDSGARIFSQLLATLLKKGGVS